MRRAGQIVGRRTEEDLMDEAQRIGDAEHARQRRHQRQADTLPVRTVEEDGLGKEHFFRQKTVEQGYPCHRRGRHDGQRRSDRHRPIQARKSLHVARAGFMVDDARRHEQRSLEGGVIRDVENRRHQRQRTVHSQQQCNEAEMADGGVGQHALHVLLEQGQVGADQQRAQAGAADDPEPQVSACQHRPEPGQQEHAGLHHGGGMQVGRNRRRRCHGMGQPEVERKLRALCQCAEHDQDQCHGIPGMALDRVCRRQNRIQVIAAGHVPEQQHAAQQRQSARAGNDKRHARAAARVHAVMPVGDEHERSEAGQLPEHGNLEQVARQHHSEHRSHECQKKGEETGHRIVRRHVVARIDHHQRADHRDQHGEQPGVAIHAQGEVQPQTGRPGNGYADDPFGGNLRIQACRQDCSRKRDDAGQPRLGIAGIGRQEGGTQAANERKKKNQEQGHALFTFIQHVSGPLVESRFYGKSFQRFPSGNKAVPQESGWLRHWNVRLMRSKR